MILQMAFKIANWKLIIPFLLIKMLKSGGDLVGLYTEAMGMLGIKLCVWNSSKAVQSQTFYYLEPFRVWFQKKATNQQDQNNMF